MNPIDFAQHKLDTTKAKPLKISITCSDGKGVVRWDCELKAGSYVKTKETNLLNFQDYPHVREPEGHVYAVTVLEDILDLMKSKSVHGNGKLGCFVEAQLIGNIRECGFLSGFNQEGIVINTNLGSGSAKEWNFRKIRTLTCHKPLFSCYRFDIEAFDSEHVELVTMLVHLNGNIIKYKGKFAVYSFKVPGSSEVVRTGLKIKLLDMKDAPLISACEILFIDEYYEEESDEDSDEEHPQTVFATPQPSSSTVKLSKKPEPKKDVKSSNNVIEQKPLLNVSTEKKEHLEKKPYVNSGDKKASVPNLITLYDIEHKLSQLFRTVVNDNLESVEAKPFDQEDLVYFIQHKMHFPSMVKSKIKDCYAALLRVVQDVALTFDGYQPKDIPETCDYLLSFGFVNGDIIQQFRNERNYVEHDEIMDVSIGSDAVKTLCRIHHRIVCNLRDYLLDASTRGGVITRFSEKFVPIKQSLEDLNKRQEEAIAVVKHVLEMSSFLNKVPAKQK